jgi:hypothetical protein
MYSFCRRRYEANAMPEIVRELIAIFDKGGSKGLFGYRHGKTLGDDEIIRQNKAMKPKLEPTEGPEAFALFDALVRKVLSVPHEEIMRREEQYKKQAAANPRKRGPKPKKTAPNS